MTAIERLTQTLEELGFGADPETNGTAARWLEVLADYAPKGLPPALETLPTPSFDPILLRDLPFHSLCAHHLLPFFGMADLAIRPRAGRITGLSALVRTLDHHARQPQLQERLGAQVAAALANGLDADVVVRLRARQMCMEMRGDRRTATVETWSAQGDTADLALLLRT